MEGNKRHPQFTLESDTKQTHFFVERTLLPRAPFARRGFIHIGKRYKDDFDFKTVIKFPTTRDNNKSTFCPRQKQFSIHKTVREITIESARAWNTYNTAQKPILMSHQHHQRMSLRVANNNNVSASVVDTTNATNTENSEENTNQMTCVTA